MKPRQLKEARGRARVKRQSLIVGRRRISSWRACCHPSSGCRAENAPRRRAGSSPLRPSLSPHQLKSCVSLCETVGRIALATRNAVLTHSITCSHRKRRIFRTLENEETVKPYHILPCSPATSPPALPYPQESRPPPFYRRT